MTNLKSDSKAANDGFILASLLITVTLVVLMGTVIAQLVVNNFQLANRDVARLQAQISADGGLDYGINQLNADNNWPGSSGEIELFNDGEVRTTFEVSVSPGSEDDERVIQSVGRAYKPATATNPASERTYEVVVEGLSPPANSNFSLVTGVGGLLMENNSRIVAGDVFVNGEIEMANSASIGLSSAPVTVRAAHQNCPAAGGSSYPQVCASGENGEPISINSPQAHIYAEVQATNQTNDSNMSNPGLVSGSPAPEELPDHDRQAQIDNISTTTSDAYYTDCSQNNTTRVWPAGLKIEGNVTIELSCEVVIEGDVWISGSLTLRNSAQINVSDSISLGGTNTVNPDFPTIMVDGMNGVVMENSATLGANNSDVGMQLITYWSRATCSPDCTDVTGTDLFESREDRTILLQNNASAPEAILYARWTQVELNNGGDIGAIVGQTVRLRNSATITFGASVDGGGGSGSANTFVVRDYRRVY